MNKKNEQRETISISKDFFTLLCYLSCRYLVNSGKIEVTRYFLDSAYPGVYNVIELKYMNQDVVTIDISEYGKEMVSAWK